MLNFKLYQLFINTNDVYAIINLQYIIIGINKMASKKEINKTPLPINAQISERISMRARELGLSQADIAKKLKCSRSTVHGWYSGSAPRPEYLRGLRDTLRVSQDWLEGVSNSPSAKDESDLFSSLDRVWDLPTGNKITTNAALFPSYGLNGGISTSNPLVLPTRFFDSIDDQRGLVFCQIENESFIYNSMDLIPQNKARSFILSLPGNEIAEASVKRDLDGLFMADINGQKVSLSSHEAITILGRCVFLASVL
jgi:transcriptional regulator with XRE-family HTH domain